MRSFNDQLFKLYRSMPFYAAIGRYIEKRENPSIPTAGVYCRDGKFYLDVNPSFFSSLSEQDKLIVLQHEFLHVALGHVTGRKPEGYSQTDNVAMDLAINQHLAGAESMKWTMPDGKETGLCYLGKDGFEDMPKGLCYEEYLQILKQRPKKGQGQEGQESQGQFDDHGNFGQGEGQSGAGEELSRQIGEALRKKILEGILRTGNAPKNLLEEIQKSLTPPVIPWESLLRQFCAMKKTGSKKTLMRKPRRPTANKGRIPIRAPKILIGIDESGSMPDEIIGKIANEIDYLAKKIEFSYIPFDTEIGEEKPYKKGFNGNYIRQCCGGTNFDAFMKYANASKADSIIIITDMGAQRPSIECNKRILWITTEALTFFDGSTPRNIIKAF